MRSFFARLTLILASTSAWTWAVDPTYTNFIRQVQSPTGVSWDVSVAASGTQLSQLAIDPGGARFELWTVKDTPLTSYLLNSVYVGTYIPVATVAVTSEDPYTIIPRTRADRPFHVDVTVNGLRGGATDPAPSKSVKFLRHVQSYGEDGTGLNLDRTQAALLTQTSIATNGSQHLTFLITSVPGSDRSKIRGEERFSVFSLADYQAPESQLASQFIQVWPVADGSISGITTGETLRFTVPQVTLTLNDLYPSSTTYAQVYQGAPQLGMSGTTVEGSMLVINDNVPSSRVLTLKDYESVFTEEGQWTMELLTKTPFGIDRLAYVTFNVDRTMRLNGSFNTIE